MPLERRVGSFVKKNTTGTQPVTGVGFTPKAVMFWTSGSTAASGTWNPGIYQMIGFTAGPTNSFAVAGSSQDAVATSNTGRRMAAKAITLVDTNAAMYAEADLASFDADGFTLNWTTAGNSAEVINFLALGGTDITGAKVVNWTTPTATGNKAVTGVGFSPDLVIHAGAATGTLPESNVNIHFGWGVMNKHGQQWANSVFDHDAQSGSNTSRFQQTDACFVNLTANETIMHQAHFVSMDADGFTVNFSTTQGSAHFVPALCLKGVSSKIGAFNKTTESVASFAEGYRQIGTSTTSAATYPNAVKKIDRCQNGVLWTMFWNGAYSTTRSLEFWYSTDNGTTWTGATESSLGYSGTGSTYGAPSSFFIDLDDFAHVVYSDPNNGLFYYRRGTPNTARTTWTWSAATQIGSNNEGWGLPYVVACRTPDSSPTTWDVFIIAHKSASVLYQRVRVANNGTLTTGNIDGLPINQSMGTVASDSFYDPSQTIDFHHTGDGKTVKDGAPHLFVGWVRQDSNGLWSVRLRKATYSAGAWTWNAERTIANYASGNAGESPLQWCQCFFDGTRVVLAGMSGDGNANYDLFLHDRDVADTTTTTRTLIDNVASSSQLARGSATYDSLGNVYLFGRLANETAGSNDLVYRKWTRVTTTLGSAVTLDTAVAEAWISVKNGYSNNQIEWVYTDGNASPYPIAYGAIRASDEVRLPPAGSPTQSITRTGFTPKAVLFSSVVDSARASPGTGSYWFLGAADGTNQRAANQQDVDAVNPTQVDSVFYNDATVAWGYGSTPVTTTKGSVTSLNPNGFSLNFTTNEANAQEVLYLALGDTGTNTYPATVGTSTDSVATGSGPGRRLDRTSNGVLWAVFENPDQTVVLRYSTDGGVTWTQHGTTFANSALPSIFIDQDDYLHLVTVKTVATTGIEYRRGTPNAGRTDWTAWSTAAVPRQSGSNIDQHPDVVAHREGTGWAVHLIYSFMTTVDNRAFYNRYTWSSGGVLTNNGETQLSAAYNVSVHTFPSIDFNHTGDGKTVAGSTPHLYAAWSTGNTGAGRGIRFRKATYSAGAWTWGTEREIDNTRYQESPLYFAQCLFDGTRVIIGGLVFSGTAADLMLYERDAADTTTTTRSLATAVAAGDRSHRSSMTYDANGSVFFFGVRDSAAPTRMSYRIWTRATMRLSSHVDLDHTIELAWPSVKRGYANGGVELVYTHGNNSPYSVMYTPVSRTPSAPTLVAPADALTVAVAPTTFDWTHNDLDLDPQQSYYLRRKRIV